MLTRLFRNLSGKKTHLGAFLGTCLSGTYLLDSLLHDQATWLSEDQYIAIAGMIAGFTGVAVRLAIAKAENAAGQASAALKDAQRTGLERE